MELLETFFDRHLPVSVGVSPNTIKSYKYAFRLLLEYMYNKHGIPAGDISFEDLNYENLTDFWTGWKMSATAVYRRKTSVCPHSCHFPDMHKTGVLMQQPFSGAAF